MTWTWTEIETSWLYPQGTLPPGDRIGIVETPEEVVEQFNRVERVFGRAWIEESRPSSGVTFDVDAIFRIVDLGVSLRYLEGGTGCAGLIAKLRGRDYSAKIELWAIRIATPTDREVRLECEPDVLVRGRCRRADFRIADHDAPPWVNVEVTHANESQAAHDVNRLMTVVRGMVEMIEGTYTVEVTFHRAPSSAELAFLKTELQRACGSPGSSTTPLPDELGTLFKGDDPDATVLDGSNGPSVAGLAQSGFFQREDGSLRRLTVRTAYADVRAVKFLDDEAGQLPEDEPGLLMVSTSNAPGAMGEWPPILETQFQLGLYNNVSAVMLFSAGFLVEPAGYRWRVESRLLANPRATHTLPNWLSTHLEPTFER